MNATPTKLKNGSWGARVQGTAHQGDTVTITTRGGKSWRARITCVLWSGKGVSICATESLDRPPRSSRRDADDGYCYHRCPVGGFICSPKNGPCHNCL